MRFAEPVDAVVLHADSERGCEPLHIVVPEDATEVLRAVERRVADDGVRPRPRHREGVARADAGQVGQRQRRLRQVQLLLRQLVPHPDHDACEADGEAVDVQALQVGHREERGERPLLGHPAARTQLRLEVGVGGVAPVIEGLRPVPVQAPRLRARLHLDDRHPRPQQVEEAAGLRLLERGHRLPVGPVAGEQLVQEGLRLRPARSGHRRSSAPRTPAGCGVSPRGAARNATAFRA